VNKTGQCFYSNRVKIQRIYSEIVDVNSWTSKLSLHNTI